MSYLATFNEDSKILRIKILDMASGSNAGKTGITSASSGLSISTIASTEAVATVYTALAGTIESITTLGTYQTPTATKCRFREVSAANHPGLYEIHLDNARFAIAGARDLIVTVHGVTGATQTDAMISLTQFDLQSATVTASSVTDKTGYTLTVTPPTVEQIDTQLSGTHGSGSWGEGTNLAPTVEEIDAQLSRTHGAGQWAEQGSGSVTWTYIVTDIMTHNPVDGVMVNVTTDVAGKNVIAQGYSNAFGEVVFYLDPGVFFFWSYRSGYTFPNPDTETVPTP